LFRTDSREGKGLIAKMRIKKSKVCEVVKKIPKGSFLSYKETAKMAGNPRAYRFVANLMAKNKDKSAPCHRVIKNNYEVGGYKGSFKNTWRKVALLLKEGAVGVMPTDTIYGICGSALNKKTVEKIYKLRKRKPEKQMIILISSLSDLKNFEIKLKLWQKKILSRIWPGPAGPVCRQAGKVSVVLPLKAGLRQKSVKTLAFRIPKDKELIEILKISGPLAAPSANWEGCSPAKTISEARKYFKDKVFYYNKGKITGRPSTLIDLTQKPIKILRQGRNYNKIRKILYQC